MRNSFADIIPLAASLRSQLNSKKIAVRDVAESKACENVYGRNAPISSLKSYMGHTLGACGGIEAGIGIHMMNNNWFAPTINLKNIDEECADIDYIVGDGRVIDTEHFVNNNFAFGGINASIIFKRWS